MVCLFFPPNPGIGGRRTAKFAKYMAKKGDELYVIHAKNIFPTTSPWFKDIDGYKGIHRMELDLNYPKEFIIPPDSLFGKIRYRLFNAYFSILHPTKNRYDYSFFWNEQLLKQARELLTRHSIPNLLISGPPFYYAHRLSVLKKEFPELNIIVDFRDPWIGSPYYGMSNLKPEQKKHEVSLLTQVYQRTNYFTAPNSFLLNEQRACIQDESLPGAELYEIPHAYDIDEVKEFMNLPVRSDNKHIRLVYGGQLYPGTDGILKALSAFLDRLKASSPALYTRLSFDFYTPQTAQKKFFLNHPEQVRFFEPQGNEIMRKLSEADYCLIFLAGHNKNYKTTKFLEYSILRKPFIVLGEKGFVAEEVERHKIGKAYNETDISELESLLSNSSQYLSTEYNNQYDFSRYSFEAVTETLRTILK